MLKGRASYLTSRPTFAQSRSELGAPRPSLLNAFWPPAGRLPILLALAPLFEQAIDHAMDDEAGDLALAALERDTPDVGLDHWA